VTIYWPLLNLAPDYEMSDQARDGADLKHLLVVLDDDAAARNSLVFLLTVEGYEVRSYSSPMELLNDANLPAFHCLIVDFHMPDMNGLDVVARLRERSHCPAAILVTSQPNAAILERATKLDVPVLIKPLHGNELVDCIRRKKPAQ
jgi:two-component system, LuxR family, response regulator FixJ